MASPKKPKVIQNPLSFYGAQGFEGGGLLSGDTTDALDPDTLKRAFERHRLPQRLRDANERIAKLETAIAKEERIKHSSRAAGLRRIIHELKRTRPDQASDALFIALRVDAHLKERKIQLHTECPKSWHKYRPSGQLVALLNPKTYPKLHKLVKSYISKA